MGRNAAFGRPPANDRLRLWWDGKSRVWRTNLMISVAVGCVVLGLMLAATSGDADRVRPRVNSAGLPTTVTTRALPLSTVVVGDLRAAGTAPDPSGSTTTSITTTTAVAPTPSSTTPTTRTTTPSSTVAQAPATTVPTTEVIFSDPVLPSTTVTVAPVVTTLPTTTTRAPVTTSTTRPGAALPLGLPPVVGG